MSTSTVHGLCWCRYFFDADQRTAHCGVPPSNALKWLCNEFTSEQSPPSN